MSRQPFANPGLSVSVRIADRYPLSDGRFYPASINHVLATLVLRTPGLGVREPVETSSASSPRPEHRPGQETMGSLKSTPAFEISELFAPQL